MPSASPAASSAASSDSGTKPSSRTRIGRPPRIDRATIAKAVIELGFDDVTMKSAAEHMGVSVPGLYHYVKGRDELVLLAAEYTLAAIEMPRFTGQDWATWLREWARYTRTSMSARPELLQHFLTGGIEDARYVEVVDGLLAVLVKQDFTPREALQAWECVSSIALGTAAADIRERAAAADGRPWIARVHGQLARHGADELGAVRALVEDGFTPQADRDFEHRLDTALAGVEVMRGLPDREGAPIDGEKR